MLDLDGTLVDERDTVDRAFLAAGRAVRRMTGVDALRFARTARVTAQRLWWKATWIDPLSDAFGLSAWDGLSEDFRGAVPELDRLRAWLPDFRRAAWRLTLDAVGVADPGAAEAAGAAYAEHRHRDVRLLAGAAVLVERLVAEERRLVVLTNGPGDGQRRKVERAGLLAHVRDVVVSTEVGFAKPDPRAVALAVARAGGRCEEAVMVGDTYDRDVLGALACEVPVVWIAGPAPVALPAHPLVAPVRSTEEVLSALYAVDGVRARPTG